MKLAAPAPRSMLPWLAERAKVSVTPALEGIAALDDGQIKGMVGFDGWLPGGCSMHVAFDDPRAFWTLVRPAFGIPFLEAGFAFVIAPVLSTNTGALRFVKGLGFREKTRFEDAFGKGVALVFHELRREDCRWIRSQQRRAA